jgi:hypothetical protein
MEKGDIDQAYPIATYECNGQYYQGRVLEIKNGTINVDHYGNLISLPLEKARLIEPKQKAA